MDVCTLVFISAVVVMYAQ